MRVVEVIALLAEGRNPGFDASLLLPAALCFDHAQVMDRAAQWPQLRGNLGGADTNHDQARLIAQIVGLHHHLLADRERVLALAERLQKLDKPDADALATLYVEYLSPIRPRVVVSGSAAELGRPETAALVRALLLVALRYTGLYRQMGGTRLLVATDLARLASSSPATP